MNVTISTNFTKLLFTIKMLVVDIIQLCNVVRQKLIFKNKILLKPLFQQQFETKKYAI